MTFSEIRKAFYESKASGKSFYVDEAYVTWIENGRLELLLGPGLAGYVEVGNFPVHRFYALDFGICLKHLRVKSVQRCAIELEVDYKDLPLRTSPQGTVLLDGSNVLRGEPGVSGFWGLLTGLERNGYRPWIIFDSNIEKVCTSYQEKVLFTFLRRLQDRFPWEAAPVADPELLRYSVTEQSGDRESGEDAELPIVTCDKYAEWKGLEFLRHGWEDRLVRPECEGNYIILRSLGLKVARSNFVSWGWGQEEGAVS